MTVLLLSGGAPNAFSFNCESESKFDRGSVDAHLLLVWPMKSCSDIKNGKLTANTSRI